MCRRRRRGNCPQQDCAQVSRGSQLIPSQVTPVSLLLAQALGDKGGEVPGKEAPPLSPSFSGSGG